MNVGRQRRAGGIQGCWLGTGRHALIVPLIAAVGVVGWSAHAAPVTTEDLLNAQDNAAEWLMYGRDYRNQRFSPLDQITPDNVKDLRPVWAFSTGGTLAGLEATPLMRDGVLYFSTDYSRVFALDARTGTMLWSFEPEYEEGLETILCCGPVNRGVALKDDLVFVNTLDARLFALEPQGRQRGLGADHRRLEEGGDRDRGAARRRRQGDRRHRRRRVRRARPPQGL